MYSKYINNIKLREEPREPIIGGVSLPMFLNKANEILGGGNSEGLKKIAHLSIPVGLVISNITSKSSYIIPHQTKIIHTTEDNILDTQVFNKLYDQTTYKINNSTSSKKQKTRRKRRS